MLLPNGFDDRNFHCGLKVQKLFYSVCCLDALAGLLVIVLYRIKTVF